ncbi:hypothetical protein K8O96_01405 [Clostridium sporogenes]|uniref:Uncharacterized protein n=1 Tax=Clostridium botulinum TaxID=1491 RepID=A0A6M0T0H2_CLOBO|nr:hypothetical protein [Clostridium sporogenes]NFA59661.1 hypothetical protein [Clostridium botulinum]NFI73208.1 hypothetical protein [Clostridium sporogenes]NFM26113.1 hypothetical protein [Clostridium sporogenes]NFP60620.1 hypothetical protein [Clostridium sporogenes]NFU93171.1 hypothetical protein [Clostridium sporogenes]
MFSKERFVIELDDRYFNQKDLINAACEYLNNKGRKCEVVNNYTLSIDGKKYSALERTISMAGVPLQQIVIKEIVGYSNNNRFITKIVDYVH